MTRMAGASGWVGNWVSVGIVLGVEGEFANFSHLEGVGFLGCGVYLSLQFNGQLDDLWERTDISGV